MDGAARRSSASCRWSDAVRPHRTPSPSRPSPSRPGRWRWLEAARVLRGARARTRPRRSAMSRKSGCRFPACAESPGVTLLCGSMLRRAKAGPKRTCANAEIPQHVQLISSQQGSRNQRRSRADARYSSSSAYSDRRLASTSLSSCIMYTADETQPLTFAPRRGSGREAARHRRISSSGARPAATR